MTTIGNRKPELFSRTCGGLVALLSFSGLAGWGLGFRQLASWGAAWIPMAPSTAFLFLGLSLRLLAPKRGRGLEAPLAVVTAATALWVLASVFLHASDPAPGPSGAVEGRMAPLTALAFLAAASASLLDRPGLDGSRRKAAGWILLGQLGVVAVVLLAYFYGVPFGYRGGTIPMALPTALAFAALSSGALAVMDPLPGPLARLAGPSLEARLLRSILPMSTLVILAVGWPPIGNTAHLSSAFVHAAAALLCSSLLVLGISRAARTISRDFMLAQQSLARSEGRYRELYDRAPCGYHTLDENGSIVSINDTELSWLGRSREELPAGTRFCELMTPESRRRFEDEFSRFKEKGNASDLEFTLVRKDGTSFPVLLSAVVVREPSGPGLSIHATVLDVTTLKSAQKENERVANQFEQSQKMEAVGRLAAGVAHDFNNLLTVIRGYAQFLADKLQGDGPARQDAEEILMAADRAAALTRQLLSFSRKQALAPVVFDLNLAVESLFSMLRRLIGEDIRLVTKLDPHLGRVKVDPGQIGQALLNLAINARDAMPRGGVLTLETANRVPTPEFLRAHPDLKPGPLVEVAVSDTGTGIDPLLIGRIFEPFFTTKETGKGTGLGLSMVYGMVKQSGGEVLVQSRPGAGSRFEIVLPRCAEADEPRASPSPDAGASVAGTETVLLVEDDELLLRLLSRTLRSYGYRVVEAGDAEEAERLIGKETAPVHLLVTDVVLPGCGGLELAGRLRAERPGLKVLFISGYANEARDSGGELLVKPFLPVELAREVRKVLDRSPVR